jgi:hypothetical protein
MRSFGRFLQLAGLVILPLAMLLEISGSLGRSGGVSQMLLMLVAGACTFFLGRMIEGYARS